MPNNTFSLDCFTLIAGKDASSTGHVMVAHNEDDYVFASLRHGYMPHKTWPNGTLLPAESGCDRVPQVNETFGYYWTQVRTPEAGLTTGDSFINENGVCVVTNSSCGSREDEEETEHKDGGICYELRRIIAERAKNARHGLEVAIGMLEQYGYNSPGRIYTIADSAEAFMLQIVRGHRYVAARVPDDALVIMPNHYTFHTLSDVPEMFYPADLVSYAIKRGWYKPAREGDYSDFDFAAAYQNTSHYRHPVNTLRQKYGTQMLLGRTWNTETDGFPFCVTAEHKVTPEDFMNVLSTHYEGTEHDVRSGNGLSPHYTDVRRICVGSTVESAVYTLEPQAWQTTVWTAFGRPCELPFIPLHPLCGAVPEIDAMDDPMREAELHHVHTEGCVARRNDGWQLIQDFQNAFDLIYSDETANPAIKAMKSSLHTELSASNAGNLDYVKTISQSEGIETLHQSDRKAARYVLRILNEIALELFDVSSLDPFDFGVSSLRASVNFTAPSLPDESTLLIWPGRSRMDVSAAKAVTGTLKNEGSKYSCEFAFDTAPFETAGPGKYEVFLSGKTVEGKAFELMTVIEVH